MNVIPYPDPYGAVKDTLVQMMAGFVFLGALFLFTVRYFLKKHKSEQLESLSKKFLYKDFQEMWQDFTSNALMWSTVFIMGIVAVYFLTYAAEVKSTFNCAVYASAMQSCHDNNMTLTCESINVPFNGIGYGGKFPAIVNYSYPQKGINNTEELGTPVVPQPGIGNGSLVNVTYCGVGSVPVPISHCLIPCTVVAPNAVWCEKYTNYEEDAARYNKKVWGPRINTSYG